MGTNSRRKTLEQERDKEEKGCISELDKYKCVFE